MGYAARRRVQGTGSRVVALECNHDKRARVVHRCTQRRNRRARCADAALRCRMADNSKHGEQTSDQRTQGGHRSSKPLSGGPLSGGPLSGGPAESVAASSRPQLKTTRSERIFNQLATKLPAASLHDSSRGRGEGDSVLHQGREPGRDSPLPCEPGVAGEWPARVSIGVRTSRIPRRPFDPLRRPSLTGPAHWRHPPTTSRDHARAPARSRGSRRRRPAPLRRRD